MRIASVTAEKAIRALSQTSTENVFIAFGTHEEHIEAAQIVAGRIADAGRNVFMITKILPPSALSFYARSMKSSVALMVGEFGEDGFLLADENGVFVKKDLSQAKKLKSERVALDGVNPEEQLTYGELYEKYLALGKISRSDNRGYDAYIECCIGGKASLKKQKRVVYSPLNGNAFEALPHVLSLIGLTDIVPIKGEAFPVRCERLGIRSVEGLYAAMEMQIPSVLKMGGEIFVMCDPDGKRVAVAVKKYGKFNVITAEKLEEMLVDYAKHSSDRSSLSRCAVATEGNEIHGVIMPVMSKNMFAMSAEMHKRFADGGETGFLIAKNGKGEFIVRKDMRISDAISVAVDILRILLG